MSSVYWEGDRLLQNGGKDRVEELGVVALDKHSNTYVLWLKDTCDVFGLPGTYLRGDEYPSIALAKQNAALSMSARIAHHMWMIKLFKEAKNDKKHSQNWVDESAAKGKIVNKSELMEFMRAD